MRKLNVAQICSISLHPKEENDIYEYREKWRFLWMVLEKEGFYKYMGRVTYTEAEIISQDSNIYCENKKVYYKPYVNIKMSNGRTYSIFFEKQEQLDAFMQSDEIKMLKFIDQ